MKSMHKFFVVFAIISMFSICVEAQIKRKKHARKPKITQKQKVKIEKGKENTFRILAAGMIGNVEEPLIYVARDAAAYELLKKYVPELPNKTEVDFVKNAVVAAFLGTKPTGGFDVTLNKETNGSLKIDSLKPKQGVMLAQVLTSPYKIALVPVNEEKMINLEIGADWQHAMQIYRVKNGEFSFSGGFAPMQKKFEIEGTIGMMRFADLVTLNFNLSGKAAEGSRKLEETASGTINGNSLVFNRIDSGTFVDLPHPPLKATGKLDSNISLVFESLPTSYADGYTGGGTLTASK